MQDAAQQNNAQEDLVGSPTMKRGNTFAASSPTRTKKAASGKLGSIMQPHNLSPPPRRRNQSPSKRQNAD